MVFKILMKNRAHKFFRIESSFLGIKSFCSNFFGKQILLGIDNLTALSYINKMGEGIKHDNLNSISKQIWKWCMERQIWLFAKYVASKDNPADEGSCLNNVNTDWELGDDAVKEIIFQFGIPTIYLFASRINTKCLKYCSWDRDPEAFAINPLTIPWNFLENKG